MSNTNLKTLFVILLVASILCFISSSDSLTSESVRGRPFKFMNGPCWSQEFRCENDKCIEKRKFCDERNDCGDNSDEKYCRNGLPCPDWSFRCQPYRSGYSHSNQAVPACVPKIWKCDGINDCSGGTEEVNCAKISESGVTSHQIMKALESTKNWLKRKRNSRSYIQKWGSNIPRTAVAFYFSHILRSSLEETTKNELAYELANSFLSRLALKTIEDITTAELSVYVNAFLAFCINPRKFFVVDMIQELRKRVDSESDANAYALLTLCNANEFITENDIANLLTAFKKAEENERTDTQAIIIMALACASAQNKGTISQKDVSDLTLDVKKKQHRNGTVDNIKTTALVLQALFASEQEADEDNFDEEKAIKHLLNSQKADGSFGGLMNTYYVLPVLTKSSLVNISGHNCPEITTSEDEELEYLKNQVGEKWNVSYSIWIGEEKYLRRSLTLSIPANTSFYSIMEYAANLDSKYKFEYNVRNQKTFIFAISDIMDDPEMEMYWYPYYLLDNSTQPILITKSPSDIIPDNEEHLLYWYRKAL